MAARTSVGEWCWRLTSTAEGMLDWYSLSAAPAGASLGDPATMLAPAALKLRPLLPTPVEYAGKPSDRFWEFEDSEVHFGAIDAGATDLTRLLLVEFALVYGNDWFVAPVRLPVGSLFRATKFQVRDTFGVVTDITPSRDTDGTPWSVFEIAGVDGFFLATDTGGIVERRSDRAGRTDSRRDGQSRVGDRASCPGRERRRLRPGRRSVASRRQPGGRYDGAHGAARIPADDTRAGALDSARAVARDASSAGAPVVDLQRAAVLRTEPDGQVRRVEPRGLVLGGSAPLRVAEEEVPREGALVERAFKHARWFDGRSLVWLGRRKSVGRGEGSSGLRFDALDRR